jgi:hypothetical protein
MHQAPQIHQVVTLSSNTYMVIEYRLFCNNCRTFSISSVGAGSVEVTTSNLEPRFECDTCGDHELISAPRRLLCH